MKKYYISLLIVLFLLSACGGISESDRINIEVRVNPEGAGNILTSGGSEIGNTAVFFAEENPGWTFAGWSGDVESFENPLSVVLSSDLELIGNFSLFSNSYRIELTASDMSSSVDLAFGQIPGATDGFDSGLDSEAPPAPPDGLHALFRVNDLKLFEDFRNSFSQNINWELSILNANPGITTFQWSLKAEEFSGSLTLHSPQSDIQIDMIEKQSFEFNLEEMDEFRITFKAEKE